MLKYVYFQCTDFFRHSKITKISWLKFLGGCLKIIRIFHPFATLFIINVCAGEKKKKAKFNRRHFVHNKTANLKIATSDVWQVMRIKM